MGFLCEHLTAYRHQNGEVEGFKGVDTTKARAKKDAIEQMKRKIDILVADGQENVVFDKSRIIKVISSMTQDELDCARGCWNSGTRY